MIDVKKFEKYLDWLSDSWDVFESNEPRESPPQKHPGEILATQYLEKQKITQTRLAELIGCTHAKVNQIINGRRAITAKFALDLERALGTPADFWISLQGSYDLHSARAKKKKYN